MYWCIIPFRSYSETTCDSDDTRKWLLDSGGKMKMVVIDKKKAH